MVWLEMKDMVLLEYSPGGGSSSVQGCVQGFVAAHHHQRLTEVTEIWSVLWYAETAVL